MTLPALPASGSTSWYSWASAIHDAADEVDTKVTGTGITEVRALTQAAYDAIGTKSATTLYVIQG